MNQYPFKQWDDKNGQGSLASVAFFLLIVLGVISAAVGYYLKTTTMLFADPTLTVFLLYGGIVAAVAGLVGLIATWK